MLAEKQVNFLRHTREGDGNPPSSHAGLADSSPAVCCLWPNSVPVQAESQLLRLIDRTLDGDMAA